MGISANGKIPIELATPAAALVAGTPEGTLLQLDGSGNETFATIPALIDGIMVSEVVDSATNINRRYLFNEIDYSGWTLPGDRIVVMRQFQGLTLNGIALEPPVADIVAGSTLILGANGKLKVRPGADVTSVTVAIVLAGSPILAGAVVTGNIHFRHN